MIFHFSAPFWHRSHSFSLFLHVKRLPRKTLEALILLHLSIISYDYSIIVATRPDPTVRPPSRFVGYKILLYFRIFQALFYLYYSKFFLIFEVLKIFRTIVEPQISTLKIRLFLLFRF